MNANCPADINASDFVEHFENAPSSPTSNEQMMSEASTGNKNHFVWVSIKTALKEFINSDPQVQELPPPPKKTP